MSAIATDSALTRQTYRRLVYGIAGVGILGLLVGFVLDQHLVGAVVYLLGAWIGGSIAFLAPKWSETTLQDERDYALHNRASGLAMGITMVLGLSFLPALYVLDAGGYIDLTGAAAGAILFASALYLLVRRLLRNRRAAQLVPRRTISRETSVIGEDHLEQRRYRRRAVRP